MAETLYVLERRADLWASLQLRWEPKTALKTKIYLLN